MGRRQLYSQVYRLQRWVFSFYAKGAYSHGQGLSREKREKRELIAENKWEKGSSNKAYARCGLRSYLQLIAFSITAETAGIRTLSSPPSPLLSPASSSLSLYLFSLPLTLLLLHTRASHTCLNGRTHLRQIFLCVLCVCVCVCVWSCCISFAKVCSQLVACLMCWLSGKSFAILAVQTAFLYHNMLWRIHNESAYNVDQSPSDFVLLWY